MLHELQHPQSGSAHLIAHHLPVTHTHTLQVCVSVWEYAGLPIRKCYCCCSFALAVSSQLTPLPSCAHLHPPLVLSLVHYLLAFSCSMCNRANPSAPSPLPTCNVCSRRKSKGKCILSRAGDKVVGNAGKYFKNARN